MPAKLNIFYLRTYSIPIELFQVQNNIIFIIVYFFKIFCFNRILYYLSCTFIVRIRTAKYSMRAVSTLDCCHVVVFIIFSYLRLVLANMVLANYGRDIFYLRVLFSVIQNWTYG